MKKSVVLTNEVSQGWIQTHVFIGRMEVRNLKRQDTRCGLYRIGKVARTYPLRHFGLSIELHRSSLSLPSSYSRLHLPTLYCHHNPVDCSAFCESPKSARQAMFAARHVFGTAQKRAFSATARQVRLIRRRLCLNITRESSRRDLSI